MSGKLWVYLSLKNVVVDSANEATVALVDSGDAAADSVVPAAGSREELPWPILILRDYGEQHN